MIGACLVALVAVWLAVTVVVERRRRTEFQLQVRALAKRMFVDPSGVPEVEFGSLYGWPTVSLIFPTAEVRLQLQQQGAIAQFGSQLYRIVLRIWPRRTRFDVRTALCVTSVPEREALLQRGRALRAELDTGADATTRSREPTNWLSEALSGRVSLSRAFWLYGLGISVLYSVVGLVIDLENRFLVAIYLIGGLALGVAQTVILWRSAANSRSRVLGRLVHAAMVLGVVVVIVMAYVLFTNWSLLDVG